MRFFYVLATSLGVVSAKTYHASFDASIGNSNGNDITGIEYRRVRSLDGTSSDSGWKTKAADEEDGFDLTKTGNPKAGYRFTDDDDSAIVWEYDTSISNIARTATWTATDTSVDSPSIGLEFFYSATFPDAASRKKRQTRSRKRQTSDIWDDGTFTSPPWQDVSVQITQDDCPEDQDFTVTATDANGNSVGSATGTNSVDLTIPADSTYPVTVKASGGVGSISTVLTNDDLPIKFAIGDGDNAPTQTFQYLLEFDFCPASDFD